jgi:hypothetical protein
MIRYVKESNEFHPVAVTCNGVVHATGIEYAIKPDDDRPVVGDFTAATTIDGETGVMTGGLDVGVYRVWARVTDVTPESPWIDCGPQFRIY